MVDSMGKMKAVPVDAVPPFPRKVTVPLFLVDSLLRSKFLDDVIEINKNRSFVDYRVLEKFNELQNFCINIPYHPFHQFRVLTGLIGILLPSGLY